MTTMLIQTREEKLPPCPATAALTLVAATAAVVATAMIVAGATKMTATAMLWTMTWAT